MNTYPSTTTVRREKLAIAKLNAENVRKYLRHLGITEHVLIHEQDYEQFLEEKGLKELGRGGEGTVYFLRGHVVKVANPDCAAATLREIAHMLHLNRIVGSGGTMGDRSRDDWPALLWVYTLSDGSLSIGMKPFDNGDVPGATLYERLNYGPPLDRARALHLIKDLCHSLVHAHRNGIIHHDLKPANVYVPYDPHQKAVVFDLGQALWQQSSWGKHWLRHEHNSHYWYNGTFRYMQHMRRMGHLAAIAMSVGTEPTEAQKAAFNQFTPTYYDDVFAYAKIIRDFVRSRKVILNQHDRSLLYQFYARLMGLTRKQHKQTDRRDHSIIAKISSVFRHQSQEPQAAPVKLEQRWATMEQVMPEADKLIGELLAAKP
jgi:serine/threonine protein kinase